MIRLALWIMFVILCIGIATGAAIAVWLISPGAP